MTIRLLDLSSALAAPLDAPQELRAALALPAHPLALLPVRLETRFFARDSGKSELRVRVFPDQIHIDSHDLRLSAEEVSSGKKYWELRWRAAGNKDRLRSAWRVLTDRYGAGRAAWVARALEPQNAVDQPRSALDDGAPFVKPPLFPDLGTPATVTRTPRAGGLPARWVATAYRGGQALAVVTGKDIVADLAVGPDSSSALAPTVSEPAKLAVDEGMRWMVDFDRAEQVGMALRLPLAVPLESAEVDALIVVGLSNEEPISGAKRLSALFDAHHYTDGLAFVRPGTPTNNSSEQRAGYASRDLRGEASFASEWPDPAPDLGPTSDAGHLAASLGLPRSGVERTLGRIADAGAKGEALAAALQTALWPATWGYYLSQFTSIDEPGREWARDHARRFLRPAGALPTLRCGRQPYGVLPVTSLAGFTASGADAPRVEQLRKILVALRDQVWRPATVGVPRAGRSDAPGADLVGVLRSDAAGKSYALRRALGPHYLRHLRLFLGEDLEALGFFARLRQLTSGLPGRIGLANALSLDSFIYEGVSDRLRVPLVRDAAGTMAYVRALLDSAPETLAQPVPSAAVPLLHALLRHALLREQAEAAARLLAGQPRSQEELLTDLELVDLISAPAPPPTWTWQRKQPVPGVVPARKVGDFLRDLTDFGAPKVRPLGELREAMSELTRADPAAVESLLPATLDATSYRLDAWVTSLATRRLSELRAAQPEGIVLGGYGWVENLRYEPAVRVAELPANEPGPLVTPRDDPGFILAPSLDQASTAGLLREAHIANGGTESSAFACNLSSARLRLAQRLFDGVRQGIPLGALLGYDVERHLHDAHLDELIDDLRRIAPAPGQDGERAVAQRVSLDGLVLKGKWEKDPVKLVFAQIKGLTQNDPRRAKLTKVLGRLAAAVDAAADAVTAEGVYQLARGNLARAVSFQNIVDGNALPPELEFARTPRTGTAITHRVAIVLDATLGQDPGSGWAAAANSPRARVEPRLDAWAARLLGPATGVEVVVAELDDKGGVVVEHRVPLPKLQLSALDLVWISGDAGVTSELAQRAHATIARTATSVPRGLRLVLSSTTNRSQRDLGDLLELAGSLRQLIAGARALDGADLQPAHANPEPRADLDELETRIGAAHQALSARRDALGHLLDQPGPRVGLLRRELLALAGFGISAGLAPLAGADGDRAAPGSAAFTTASAVFTDVQRRVSDADRERSGAPGESELSRRERLLRRVRGVFGPGFVAVPVFKATTAGDLAASRQSASLLAEDPLAAHTWLSRMERVRPALTRLTMPYRFAEVLRTSSLDLSVAHVPHAGDRPWVGIRLASDQRGPSPDGVVSLVLVGASKLKDFAGSLAGLLVDEWTEIVPNRTETAGLAFRYDPPDAMAPQAVLLAVPPNPAQAWTLGSLNRVLLETLDLAHLRAVGPESLEIVGHYLPATMLAFNAEGDAVSTDPNSLLPTISP